MSRSTEQAIDWTPIYESLADAQRRRLLQVLTQTTGPVDVADVADSLLEMGDGATTDERLARIEMRLFHVHLPKLADAGLVQWAPGQETVALTDLGLRLPVAILRPQPLAPIRNAPENASD